ncbi:nucleotide-binding protein [Geomonas sp. RF6]|uniref:nucleotide-binding protein n=1 Tax=Geomonas sp. RF6 TaxID=2897342 RepID=UPI001E30A6A9|nr:nucleotide-binding protein [Geomonas sp. RF6]UFS71955.1 nucleotide-binding protein [Geomonas sp. RF6]
MAKPSLFIGSSTEGLEFARAVRSQLEDVAEVTVWKEGFFKPGGTFIDTLVNAVSRFDFAVLVLTPDDLVVSRDVEQLTPRDNVIFELGLFMGRLGRPRTFLLHQADIKIPSDVAGVTTAVYNWPRGDNNYLSAVGAACDSIRNVIRDMGMSDLKTAYAISNITSRQEQQEKQLSQHEAEIRSIQIALQSVVTVYEFEKLVGLGKDEPFLCYYSDDLLAELKRLRAMGLARHHEGSGLSAIRQQYKDSPDQFDLRRFFYITEQGREYLQIRRRLLKDEGTEKL